MLHHELLFPTVPNEELDELFSKVYAEMTSGVYGHYYLFRSSQPFLQEYIANNFPSKTIKNICCIGVGGSSRSIHALWDTFLHTQKKLCILDTLSDALFDKVCSGLTLQNTAFILITKSGTTREPMLLFERVCQYFDIQEKEIHKHFLFITDPESPLDEKGKMQNVKTYHIPKNVGGRWSGMSAVGIIPMQLAGYNTSQFLAGAAACWNDIFSKKRPELFQKVHYYAKHAEKPIHVLWCYETLFSGFNQWYSQLLSESLGKRKDDGCVGFTPVELISTKDQHSFAQLLVDGPQDKMVTFLSVNMLDVPKKRDFPSFQDNILEFVNAYKAAIQSRHEGVDHITLDNLDAWHMGYLMYYQQIFVASMALHLGIDAYDQPGVEAGKNFLKKNLLF